MSGIVGSSFAGSAIKFAFNEGDEATDGKLMLRYPAAKGREEKLKGAELGEYEKLTDVQKRAYDYVVSYADNYKKGTGKLIITGVNAYQGKVTKTFKISPCDLAKAGNLTCPETAGYTKKGCRPSNITVTATFNGTSRTLSEGTDYKVSCSNNKKVGDKATITITGMGNYSGKIKKTYTVSRATLDGFKVMIEAPVYSDKIGNFVCKVTAYDADWTKLTQGVDYTVAYTSATVLDPRKDKVKRKAAVTCTVKGMNNFNETSGGREFTFGLKDFPQSNTTIKPPVPLSSLKFVVGDYVYTGKEIYPSEASIKAYDKNGNYISSNHYYIVSRENNVNVGTGTIILKGTNPETYSGTYKLKFRILPRTVDSGTTKIK